MWPVKKEIPEPHKLKTSENIYIWEVIVWKAHLQLELDRESVNTFQVYSVSNLRIKDFRVLQVAHKLQKVEKKTSWKQIKKQVSIQLASSHKYRSAKIPKAHKNAQQEQNTSETVLSEEETNYEQESDVDQEVIIRSPQAPTRMYVPYIEGPKMNWTVDDSLYNRFIKWKIKCENILECELAMLLESRKCKKVVAWSGDFGIDQYISQDLSPEEICLEVIWRKFEEFCKPQTNEIRARFDLLTSFRQGEHSVDKLYNAVQAPINLARYPQETPRILQRDIFWFFLKDEEFVSRTINDSNIDLDKFPASKVRQFAKKLESSRSTAKHIKQVSNEPHATQVNLLRHQCTELPPTKFQRKQRKSFKSRPANPKYQQEDRYSERLPQANRKFKQAHTNEEERCNKCGDTPHIEGFRCPVADIIADIVIK